MPVTLAQALAADVVGNGADANDMDTWQVAVVAAYWQAVDEVSGLARCEHDRAQEALEACGLDVAAAVRKVQQDDDDRARPY